ncbi:hypothetical protein O0L34_g2772 [Tuta absoluta]|nr:hypothetical protein O0L34_g2772 [Tuta absoluta]
MDRWFLARWSPNCSSSRLIPTTQPEEQSRSTSEDTRRIAKGDCSVTASTSHTQYFRKDPSDEGKMKRITTDQYLGISESISGSSDSFQCVHKIESKKYTKRGLLKRNFMKNLDPIPLKPKLTEDCPPLIGWEMAQKLAFLVNDPVGSQQIDRLQEYLRDFAKTSSKGFRIDTLDNLSDVLEFIVDSLEKKQPYFREGFIELMKNVEKPIFLTVSSDIVKYFDSLRSFITHLGSLLLAMEDDDLFDLVSKGLLYQLSASDKQRGENSVRLRHSLIAARKVLYQTAARMIALAKPSRFPTFVHIALLLACDCEDNCVDLMMENIFETIFYRFNPYFPERELPAYDVNPCDLDDIYVQLGASTTNMQMVLSLMVVLVQTIRLFLKEHPEYRRIFPIPDEYSQRCFVWAFRYECRAREHRHQRNTLVVIAHTLIHIFDGKLVVFGCKLMPDVLALSVLTEIPPDQSSWLSLVSFNITQKDVQFKILLMHLSVDFLRKYPINQFMAENFIIGLMYLVDPGLSKLRTKWAPILYAELQKCALQSLICALKVANPDMATQISLIRRLMWYIEWYSVNPYEMPVLYWSVRLMQTSLLDRGSPQRASAVSELLNTHSVIIILHLVDELLNQKLPPVEKCQSIIGLCLRILTSCLEVRTAKPQISCYVYPAIKWPHSINPLVMKMLNIVKFALQKGNICSDRWLLSVMNLIWEAIVWKQVNKQAFIANNGIYQLLDIITLTRYPVQCITLALICDLMREGGAIGQLITWRANMHASTMRPILVTSGSTIAAMLAALFWRDCLFKKVQLDENGVIQDLDFPLMSPKRKNYMFSKDFFEKRNQQTPFSLAAFSVAGSRMAKCYAILQMLSEDLKEKVALADEAYNLYKNIKLTEKDETILVLVSHFLTIKLNEVWLETQVQTHGYIPIDTNIMNEFLEIGRGWTKSIQQQQMQVQEKFKKMEEIEENNLYSFLGRIRLNTSLDALRELKCIARSTDRATFTHALIFDAVRAYHRRSMVANKIMAPVVQTYLPPVDDYNMTSQNIKVINILPKHVNTKRDDYMFQKTGSNARDTSQMITDEESVIEVQGKRKGNMSHSSKYSLGGEMFGESKQIMHGEDSQESVKPEPFHRQSEESI